jgi:ABC-type nickel/cobalt efflux system permease component RcnA
VLKRSLFRWRRTLIALISVIVFALCTSRIAQAHPMGNFSVNHYAKIDLKSDRVTIQYIIDLAEIPAFQEMQEAGIQADVNDPAVLRLIAERGAALEHGLILTVDGSLLPMRLVTKSILFPPGAGGLPTMKMGFVYEAAYPAGIDRNQVRIRYTDNNYPGHAGWKEVIAAASDGTLTSTSAPSTDRSNALADYPTDLLNSPPQSLEATLVAALPVLPATAAGRDSAFSTIPAHIASTASVLRKTNPQNHADALTEKVGTATKGSKASAPGASKQSVPRIGEPAAQTPLVLQANRQQTPRSRFTELISFPNLSLWFLITAALIAAGLGALHALEPGHGKTIVAAYLVGSRGTAAHAVLLGLIVTVSHTAGVFALGAITLYASHYIVPENLYPWLGVFSGVTIAALGITMAMRRLTGVSTEHSHLPGDGHSHFTFFKRGASGPEQKSNELAQVISAKSIPFSQLLALGVTGGIVPCPAALIVLLSAFALHRIGLGFFLIVAFSVGLAAVLIAFGLMMVFAARMMARLAIDGPITKKWLPVASSIFISVLGIALIVQASLTMGFHLPAFSQSTFGTLLFVTGLGLVLGMRHSTDADHVVAISTIVSRQKSIRGAAVIGSVWGIGHTITIFIVGALIILFNVEIPPRVGLSMEFSVAVMLVLLGVLNLSGLMRKIMDFFAARDVRGAGNIVTNRGEAVASVGAMTWSGNLVHNFGVFNLVRPLAIGLVHGLAGSAAVALLVLSTIHDPIWATCYLLIFGAGTMLGMMAMTAAMADSEPKSEASAASKVGRRPACPAARARPGAAPAWGCARPAGRWARRRAAPAAGNDQQAAAAHVRALLIPQRQLAGELRVLIDARLDLLRAVDQAGLGEVVDHRCAVVRAVAAAGDPADQVVAVGGSEGQNLDKLQAVSPGSFISTKLGCMGCVVCSPLAMPTSVATVHRSSRL